MATGESCGDRGAGGLVSRTTTGERPGSSEEVLGAPRRLLAVETFGVSKHFGELRAVEELDLKIAEGEIYCLVGPNGAGKTTLLNLLSTQLRPTSGRATVLGFDMVGQEAEIRRALAIVPQEARPDGYLKVREHIVYYLLARGMRRREAHAVGRETAERLGLGDRWDAMVGGLSGGMRRRVLLCMALATGSPFLLLDEPTAGLDILVRRRTWEALSEARNNSTLILTTHSMEEAESLADRIGILDRGRLVAEGTPEELRGLAPAARKIVVGKDAVPWAVLDTLGAVRQHAGKWVVFPRSQEALRDLLDLTVRGRIEAGISNASLEDVFIHLVEHPSVPNGGGRERS